MTNFNQLSLGLQVKKAREELSNAQERLELALETQAIYKSISADLMSGVIELAAVKADNAVLATKKKFDEAQENLRLIERTPAHFNDDDYGGSYANDGDGDVDDAYDSDGYNVDGYDVDGYDVDGYDVDGYNVDGYDVDGYDVDGYDVEGYDVGGYDDDGYNIFGISAVTVDSYE